MGTGVFVGRERELNDLLTALTETHAGRGAVYLLVGERGVGKTRLAAEFADAAPPRGAAVLSGRTFEGERSPSYWLWLQVIRQCRKIECSRSDPRLLDAPDALLRALPAATDANRIEIMEVTADLLKALARRQPAVIVLDDLHLADAGSLSMLQFISREVLDSRLLIVATYRDEEVKRRPSLAAALGGIDQRARHLALSRFDRNQAAELLRAEGVSRLPESLLDSVYDQTRGNPFFLHKIAGLLRVSHSSGVTLPAELPIPAGVREEVIGYRLRGLSDNCRAVLRTAAIMGDEIRVDLLMRAGVPSPLATGRMQIGPHPSIIDHAAVLQAIEEGLLTGLLCTRDGSPDRYAFTYPLVRTALYDDLALDERSRLHRRIGEALEDLSAVDSGPYLSELARHFLCAGQDADLDKGIRYAMRAGERALAGLAFTDAVRHYQDAAGAVRRRRAGDASLALQRGCEVLLALSNAQFHAGERTAARQSCRQAAEIARRILASGESVGGEMLARAALGYGAGRAWSAVGVMDELLVAMLREALLALNEGDNAWRARVVGRLGQEFWYPDFDSGTWRDALTREAVAMARRLGDPAVLFDVLHNRHMAVWFPDNLRERTEMASEMVVLSRQINDQRREAAAHALRARDLLEEGAMIEHGREVRFAAELAHALHDDVLAWEMEALRVTRAVFEGRLDEAQRLGDTLRERGELVQPDDASTFSAVHFYALHRMQGRFEEMEPLARAFCDAYPTIPVWRVGVADVYAQLGKETEARQAFEIFAASDFSEPPMDWNWLLARVLLAEVCAFLRDKERAATLYESLLPFEDQNATAIPGLACTGAVAYQLGLLATTLERREEAARHFEHAIARNLQMGAVPFAAHAKHAYAAMLVRSLEVGEAAGHSVADEALPEQQAQANAIRPRNGGSLLEKAGALLEEAIATYERLGLQVFAERDKRLRREAQGLKARLKEAAARNRFDQDGRYWRITWQGKSARMKNSLGVRYIVYLLRHPNVAIHVIELEAVAGRRAQAAHGDVRGTINPAAEGLQVILTGSDATVVDSQARRDYQHRLRELEVELAEADAHNDLGRAERLRGERAHLQKAVLEAFARRGFDEKPRKRVLKNVTEALGKIRGVLPALADHLVASIETGTFCRYAPQNPTAWELP